MVLGEIRPDETTTFFRTLPRRGKKAADRMPCGPAAGPSNATCPLESYGSDRLSQLLDLPRIGHWVALEPFADIERWLKRPNLFRLPGRFIASAGENQGGRKKKPRFNALGI